VLARRILADGAREDIGRRSLDVGAGSIAAPSHVHRSAGTVARACPSQCATIAQDAASAYLAGTDLEADGVPTATPAQVQRASALIDAYLKRPEGCVWAPDTAGNPKGGLAPTITWKPPVRRCHLVGAMQLILRTRSELCRDRAFLVFL